MSLSKKAVIVVEMENAEHDGRKGYGFFIHELIDGKKRMITGVAASNKKRALLAALKDVKWYLENRFL